MFEDSEGLTADRSEADLELEAHGRKCLGMRWHPCAESVIATYGMDKTIKLWDVDNSDEASITFTDIPDFSSSAEWSADGKMLLAMCKNKSFVTLDPRTEAAALKAACHQGPRQ